MVKMTCDSCLCRIGKMYDGGRDVSYVKGPSLYAKTGPGESAYIGIQVGEYCNECVLKAWEAFKAAL